MAGGQLSLLWFKQSMAGMRQTLAVELERLRLNTCCRAQLTSAGVRFAASMMSEARYITCTPTMYCSSSMNQFYSFLENKNKVTMQWPAFHSQRPY